MKYPMPTAVCDWLDEQLEARGIDALIYTRYILSLLQQETADLPEEVFFLNKSKENYRRGQKWKDEYCNVCDFEQLKRSAAVECLMSASDQKSGIEKLVDELCEKLKTVQCTGEESTEDKPLEPLDSVINQSPEELARLYYAAFPALSTKSRSQTLPSQDLSIQADIDTCFPNILKADSKGALGSYAKAITEEKHKNFIGEHTIGKADILSQMSTSRNTEKSIEKCNEKSITQEMEKYSAEEEAKLMAKFNSGLEALWSSNSSPILNEQCISPESVQSLHRVSSPREFVLSPYLLPPPSACSNIAFIRSGTNLTNSIWSDQSINDHYTSEENQNISDYHNFISGSKFENEHSLNLSAIGDCRIVGSRHVRDVPLDNPHLKFEGNFSTELKNFQNSQNISNLPSNTFWKAPGPHPYNGNVLWDKCSLSISDCSDGEPYSYKNWPDIKGYCRDFNYFSNCLKSDKVNHDSLFTSKISDVDCYDDEDGKVEQGNDCIGNTYGNLNHSRQFSCFIEVNSGNPNSAENIIANISDIQNTLNECPNNNHSQSTDADNVDDGNDQVEEEEEEEEEEDLLSSQRTHFCPIGNESFESISSYTSSYADGTTFVIPDALDDVPFVRSSSGFLYLENDPNQEKHKKYMEYRVRDHLRGKKNSSYSRSSSTESYDRETFVPKFQVYENEKYCQTDEFDDGSNQHWDERNFRNEKYESSKAQPNDENDEDFYFPGDNFAETIVNALEQGEDDDDDDDTSINLNASYLQCEVCKTDSENINTCICLSKNTDPNVIKGWCSKCIDNNNRAWKIGWKESASIWQNEMENSSKTWEWRETKEKCDCTENIWKEMGLVGQNSDIGYESPDLHRLRQEAEVSGHLLMSEVDCAVDSLLRSLSVNSSPEQDDSACRIWIGIPNPEEDKREKPRDNENNRSHPPIDDKLLVDVLLVSVFHPKTDWIGQLSSFGRQKEYFQDVWNLADNIATSQSDIHQPLSGKQVLLDIGYIEKLGWLSKVEKLKFKRSVDDLNSSLLDLNERPFIKVAETEDRKRRHSSSAPQDVPCRLAGATGDLKGDASLRPVTL